MTVSDAPYRNNDCDDRYRVCAQMLTLADGDAVTPEGLGMDLGIATGYVVAQLGLLAEAGVVEKRGRNYWGLTEAYMLPREDD